MASPEHERALHRLEAGMLSLCAEIVVPSADFSFAQDKETQRR